MRHPVVGDIEVTGQALSVQTDPGLTIIAYTVEPAGPQLKQSASPSPAPSTIRTRVVARRPQESDGDHHLIARGTRGSHACYPPTTSKIA